MSSNGSNSNASSDIRNISLSYNNADSQTSALRLVLTLYPDWEHGDGAIEFIRFTDGITNTVSVFRKHEDCDCVVLNRS